MDCPVDEVKTAISEVKDLYIILDHTRTILITISDGSLPSNVGGGGNVRNILRRVFMIMKKNGWWEKMGMENLLLLFQMHKVDLEGVFGKFAEYKSFDGIIKVEHERWLNTDDAQAKNLKALVDKKKKGKNSNGLLDIEDWIIAMTSWGIPADKIAEISKQPIPGNLYYEIATRQEKVAVAPAKILYNTVHIPETKNLYYDDGKMSKFSAIVLDVFANVLKNNEKNLLILD